MSHTSPQIEALLREQAEAISRSLSEPAQEVPTTADTSPIVKINVHEGRIILAEFYTPGLPDGEHDLWPVRVTLTEEDEALAKAAEALVQAANKCATQPQPAQAGEQAGAQAGGAPELPETWALITKLVAASIDASRTPSGSLKAVYEAEELLHAHLTTMAAIPEAKEKLCDRSGG